MDITPILSNRMQKIWNAVELRLLVLLSLFFQFVLIFTGNRRKYTRNKLVSPTLWFCYLAADSVATLALGVLSQAEGDSEKNSVDAKHTITVFWAPFLLMHLGGPDTITAYALADNELWSRHLLSLVSQVGVSVYVYVRSFTRVSLNFLWLVIFFAGVVKYGERSLVLYNASKNRYRDSLISRPDPGPNYAKFVDEATSREEEGYRVELGNLVPGVPSSTHEAHEDVDCDVLAKANEFFGTFKKLFADLILSFQDREESVSYFTNLSSKQAFDIVEIELGLVYDLFYTKSPLVFSKRGCFLRVFSCSSTIATFVIFLFLKNSYPKTEVIITFVLLVGAIFLEMYAILVLFCFGQNDDFVGIRPDNKAGRETTRIHITALPLSFGSGKREMVEFGGTIQHY
ncbi:uncharacterized protein LOC125208040 [Salvia hispanica]|uniref:uncharacterized protein LOC125208040 n=1 Tax=Salvia hispanica TaxID=49212 RepID=UPI002008F49A|nr:uncharacterized protein LOC125208040 [Salvia hispanica]